jgi:hypothetical protein
VISVLVLLVDVVPCLLFCWVQKEKHSQVARDYLGGGGGGGILNFDAIEDDDVAETS